MEGKLVQPEVYIIHGQHRKLVLEDKIKRILHEQATGENVHTPLYVFPKLKSLTEKQVHDHPDAYWLMDLYKPGNLHSMNQAMSC